MSKIVSIICAVFIFCLIVVVHEFGHFIVARLCGIDVNEFSIGMGPAIFKKQGKKTLFSVRALPLGGFCSFAGEDDDLEDNGFRKASVWKRIAVSVAGPVMNFILGFIIAIILLLVSQKYTSSIVAEVVPGSGCEQAGLAIGDRIISMNGRHIFTANDIVYQLRTDEDGILDFVVVRDGQKIVMNGVPFNLIIDEQTGERILNFDFKVYNMELTASKLIPEACNKFMYYSRLILISFGDLITGKYGLNDLQGPVGVVTVITESVEEIGFDAEHFKEIVENMLDIAMLITVNLGIFNLLPIPALDGGKLVIYFAEVITRKQIKPELEAGISIAGFLLLMLVMIATTFNDIKNLFV